MFQSRASASHSGLIAGKWEVVQLDIISRDEVEFYFSIFSFFDEFYKNIINKISKDINNTIYLPN